jgi:hypothetical protein
MSARIECVDHPVFAVHDLTAASEHFLKLGFAVPPIGKHKEWGTGNLCIMFEHDYLEIRGIVDPTRYLAGLVEFLADGEGLIGVAFGTLSAEESYSAAKSAGIAVSEPRGLHRPMQVADGVIDLRFRNVMLEPEDHPGFSHANLCQHLTPELMRQPGSTDHPNTAVSVNLVVGVVDSLERAQSRYEVLVGKDSVARRGDSLWLRFPTGASVELISADEAERRGIAQPARVSNYTAAISVNVRDLDVLQAILAENGVRFVREGRSIQIATDDACGAHLRFVEFQDA